MKKQADQIRATKLLEAAQKGDLDLLKEIKKLNSKKTSGSLPETVENADNPEDIVDKFRSVYSASYNSAQTEIDELWANLVIGNDACRMKPGKSDVSGGQTWK